MPAPGPELERIRLEVRCPICSQLVVVIGAWPVDRPKPTGIRAGHGARGHRPDFVFPPGVAEPVSVGYRSSRRRLD